MGLRELRSGFGINTSKPKARQATTIVYLLAPILVGPLLILILIDAYPFLITNEALYRGALISVVFFFLLSFVIFRRDPSLLKFPLIMRTLFRFGWGLGSAALFWGFVGIANGLGTPLETRQVPVVAKHPTRQRDPARRTCYIAVRPWPYSRVVVELDGPRATYDRLSVPIDAIDTPQEVLANMPDAGKVNLIIGKGRLGLAWLKRIEPVAESSNPHL